MFARILYVDESVSLELNWLGIGGLVARHKFGAKRKAHPIQKKAFLIACSAFEACGQPLSPSNPKFSLMAKEVAEMLLYQSPGGLHWSVMFSDPEGFGIGFASR